MSIRLSGRIVSAASPIVDPMVVPIRLNGDCNIKTKECIAQGAEKTILLTDQASVDYTGLADATFDIWQGGISGTNLFSASLSGGTLAVVQKNAIRVPMSSAQTLAFPKGRHWVEAWIERSNGGKVLVAFGWLTFNDTRKYDA